jgi:hypothetical protein
MEFRPHRLLRSPHLQTLLSSRIVRGGDGVGADLHQRAEPVVLEARDGARLQALVDPPRGTGANEPLVVVIHGWLGRADSPYVRRAASALHAAGFRVARLHLRDHGDTAHLNEELFNAARITEVVDVCNALASRYGAEGAGRARRGEHRAQWRTLRLSRGPHPALGAGPLSGRVVRRQRRISTSTVERSTVTAHDEPTAVDEATLLGAVRALHDNAPGTLIDACAARGEPMAQAIDALISAPGFWTDDVDEGAWWQRLHAAMILGLLDSAEAGRVLVELMRGLGRSGDDGMMEWLSGYWPALFANKPAGLADALRELVTDGSCDPFLRTEAAETVVALASRDGAAAVEAALDWAAEVAANEQQDWVLRLGLGNLLLDFPRDRHRALIDDFVARQRGLGKRFDADDVETAYARGEDEPEWLRFADPWRFYEPEVIADRQKRWADEDRERAQGNRYGSQGAGGALLEPYVRSERKVGRNDPCPCGSGRKYKKCCLGKVG